MQREGSSVWRFCRKGRHMTPKEGPTASDSYYVCPACLLRRDAAEIREVTDRIRSKRRAALDNLKDA